jgi:PPM family protein phosphatase
MPKFDFLSLSFVGLRENNEDACLALPLGDHGLFLAVADGMGGFAGGDVASKLVLDRVSQVLVSRFEHEVKQEHLKPMLTEIYQQAQAVVQDEKGKRTDLQGMGTTLTCVLIVDDHYVVGNIGDSRVYLLDSGHIRQLTVDHTYIQEAQKDADSVLEPSIIKRYGNIITRSVEGGHDTPDIFPQDQQSFRLREGDAFLLCSDGLFDKGTNPEKTLEGQLLGSKSIKEAAERMISHAFLGGSKDNITVVLAAYGSIPQREVRLPAYSYPPRIRSKSLPRQRFDSHLPHYVSAGVFGLILLSSILLLYSYFDDFTKSTPKGARSSTRVANHTDEPSDTLHPSATASKEIQPNLEALLQEWDPFRAFVKEGRSVNLQEQFIWSDFSLRDSVDYYELSFGNIKQTNHLTTNSLYLKEVTGLKAGQCEVTITLMLKNGESKTKSRKIDFK